MELCSEGHEEVCFEGRTCPVCEKMDEIKDLENEVEALTTKVENLENDIKEMEEE